MNVPFVDLQIQYQGIKEEIDQAIAGVLSRSDYVLGRSVAELEERFAAYCEVPYAVGVDSGLSALEMILYGYGIGPGDEVITAANTFIATVLAISHVGARPVLVDIDPRTYNMNPEKLEAAITPATRAILPVHLFGQTADMDPILEIARRHKLYVIEDACQAHGARYKGRRTGTFGNAAAFSFYPSKNLGAYGDGGAVVTRDADLADRIKVLRNVGQRVKYIHEVKGFNHRLDTLQAAVLLAKLPHLDDWNTARRRAAAMFDELLTPHVITPCIAVDNEPVYHLYVIRTKDRDSLQNHLKQKGIATGIHYPIPIHLQPAYQELGYKKGDFPATEQCADEMLSLPMYPELDAEKIVYTSSQIAEYVQAKLSVVS